MMYPKLEVNFKVKHLGVAKTRGRFTQFEGTVEVAEGVRVKVQRHTVGTVLPKGTLKNA